MGRHSAPEHQDQDVVGVISSEAGAVRVGGPAALGRHAKPEASVDTVDLDSDDMAAGVPFEPATELDGQPAVRREHGGTRADLRLLRHRPALLARCLAAVVVPFLLCALVLLVIGRLHSYLFWIWIPAIVAGSTAGAMIDAAHRRAAQQA